MTKVSPLSRQHSFQADYELSTSDPPILPTLQKFQKKKKKKTY